MLSQIQYMMIRKTIQINSCQWMNNKVNATKKNNVVCFKDGYKRLLTKRKMIEVEYPYLNYTGKKSVSFKYFVHDYFSEYLKYDDCLYVSDGNTQFESIQNLVYLLENLPKNTELIFDVSSNLTNDPKYFVQRFNDIEYIDACLNENEWIIYCKKF